MAGQTDGTAEGGPVDEHIVARRKRRRRFTIFGGLTIAAFLGGGIYWLSTRNFESTDDAFIEADIIQIAPQVGGIVAAVHVTDNQRVAAGARLIDIDTADLDASRAAAEAALNVAQAQEQAAGADLELTRTITDAAVDQAREAVEQARHQVAEAEQSADAASADATRATADVKRYEELFKTADVSRQRLEQASADAKSTTARWRAARMAAIAASAARAQAEARYRDAQAAPARIAQKEAQLSNAHAQVEQAQANLQAARLNLSYAHISAPKAGRIGRRAVNAGDVVQKGQILAGLVVDPPWIVANFKETQLTRMRPGQPVTIVVDAYPDHRLAGRVDSLQPGSGARFSLLPPENATGNYVKVVQRVPVKIVFTDPPDEVLGRLSPGMSVVPEVDVSAAGTPPGAGPAK